MGSFPTRTLLAGLMCWLMATGSALPALAARSVPPCQVASGNATPPAAPPPCGPLMFIGGGKDQDDLMRGFFNLAHGPVVIVPLASDDPARSGEAYVTYCRRLGKADVQSLIPRGEPTDADRALIASAGGFFFSGGDQARLMRTLPGTWQTLLQQAWRRGAVVAGTSAGAMVWGPRAIMGGEPMETAWHGEDPPFSGIRLGPGLGISQNLVVDTHFSQRGRVPRLAYAIAATPGSIGIGVDPETTAVVYPDGRLVVSGRGTVTLLTLSAPATLPLKRPLSLKDMRLSLLSAGDQVRLPGAAPVSARN